MSKFTIPILLQIYLLVGMIGAIFESLAYSVSCGPQGQEKPWTIKAIRTPNGNYFRYKGTVNPLMVLPKIIDSGIVYSLAIFALLYINKIIPNVPLYVKVFIFSSFATIFELTLGLFFNKTHKSWDYSENFMNYKGDIDLQHFLLWGLGGSFIVLVVIPYLMPIMKKNGIWISKHPIIVSILLLLCLYILYQSEKPYDKGKENNVVKFFAKIEPDFPKKRKRCKI